MTRLNRDATVAIFLLLFCGVFISASFEIEETNYGTMPSSVWPQIVLAMLTVFSLALLGQALRAGPAAERTGGGIAGWLKRYRNALVCYALFLLFLLTLPVFGMLLGGVLFVFTTLTVLGPPDPRKLVLHAIIAVVSVGAMWSVFTFGLRVFLPEGMLFSFQ